VAVISLPGRLVGRLLAVLVVAGAFAGGAVVVSLHTSSPSQVAADAKPPPSRVLTAGVKYQVLRDSLVFRADVLDANPSVASAPSDLGGAQPVITSMAVRPGQQVSDGQVVASVSTRPIELATGMVPAFRTMKPGDSGVDVQQLQAVLGRAGLLAGSPDGMFGTGTSQAVRALYARNGFAVSLTSPDADRQLQVAERTATRDRLTLAAASAAASSAALPTSAPPAAGPPAGTPSPPAARPAASPAAGPPAGPPAGPGGVDAVATARQQLADDTSALEFLRRTTGPTVPLGEIVFVPQLPSRVLSVAGGVGQQVKPDTPIVSVGSGAVIARGGIDISQRKGLKTGQKAVLDPGGTGSTAGTFPAVITAIAAQPAGDPSSGPPQIPVTLSVAGSIPAGLVGANVAVRIDLASSNGPVDIVPLAAIGATAEGGSSVSVLLPDGRQRAVPVQVLLSTDSGVAVKAQPGALGAGDRVVLGESSTP